MVKRFGLGLVALTFVLVAPEASAQMDKYTRSDGIRDRVQIRAGFFLPSHNTFVRLQPAGVPDIPGFDLEADTQFADSTNDFRGEIGFKLGRRHLIRLGYVSMNRATETRLTGEIEWGTETFPVDADIVGHWDTRVFKFDYRYSLIKSDKVDFGLSLGIFAMRISSGLALAGENASRDDDVRKTAPLPMLGGSLEILLADRWMLRGGAQYLGISIDDTVDGSWLEARGAIEYNLTNNLGLAAGFLLADIDVAAQLSEATLSEIEYRYDFSGPFFYAFANF